MTVDIIDCEQLSDDWWHARLGIPTASEFKSVMAKGEGKTRKAYMLKLLGERLTGEPAERYSNDHMERGRLIEAEARHLYAFMQDANPLPVGFIRNGPVGCSPDSLISDVGLLEIKTRLPHLQIDVLLAGKLPPENKAQVQGQLWITEREWCDFVSYWPRLPLFVLRVYRDEDYIKTIQSEVKAFLDEMDVIENRLRQMDGPSTTMAMLRESATALGA